MDITTTKPATNSTNNYQENIRRHLQATEKFFAEYAQELHALAELLSVQLQTDKKLIICGNGGSACDAMHIAGEFVGRFVKERAGLAAIALSADSGIITAIGNDYGFERIFARQVEALGQTGDVLIALSTSGSSPNILAALREAKQKDIYTVLLTGEKGRQIKEADLLLVVPETSTARIQEVHITALHILAELVETRICEGMI